MIPKNVVNMHSTLLASVLDSLLILSIKGIRESNALIGEHCLIIVKHGYQQLLIETDHK